MLWAGILAGRNHEWEGIDLYETYAHQGRVAEAPGLSRATISRGLVDANYWGIRASLDDLETVLGNRQSRYNGIRVAPASD